MACNSAVMPDMHVIPSEKSDISQARKLSPELLSLNLMPFYIHCSDRRAAATAER